MNANGTDNGGHMRFSDWNGVDGIAAPPAAEVRDVSGLDG